ncbi:MAG: acyl-CoA thioesterase [Balneolaceae bacterium]|nr:acyl-CoA thioesterase [Balneolaceae bacterium]MBO6547257.1 acyl-CoA thioesterase [Balneolaceae bacterium]MBO6647796.1 acyl-CoA thioesterase [Balneolaceae bacterium]
MKKILSSIKQIRFQDCDPFNHLNNSKYIDYFMNAREDHLIEHYGLNVYEEANKNGLTWVVGSNMIAYINPAVNMEEVLIESQLIKYGRKNLTVEMRMWDKEKTRIKALLWSTFVHFDLIKNHSHSHEQRFIDLFEQVVEPVEQNSFEQRNRFLSVKYARAS